MKRHISNYKKKPEKESAETVENIKKSDVDKTDENSWAEDQRENDYYYDDSYGYEVYDPDAEDDEDI